MEIAKTHDVFHYAIEDGENISIFYIHTFISVFLFFSKIVKLYYPHVSDFHSIISNIRSPSRERINGRMQRLLELEVQNPTNLYSVSSFY